MELELLKTLGQIAGIVGISLGVFLLLFRDIIRKKIFPQLTKQQAFQLLILISILVWSIALSGLGAWVWSNMQSNMQSDIVTGDVNTLQIEKNAAGVIHTGEGNVIITKPATQ